MVDPITNRVAPKKVRARDMMIVVTVDPAASVASGIPEDLLAGMEIDSEAQATSSRSAALVIGILPDRKVFLLDLFVGRVEIPDLVRMLKTIDRKWHPTYFRIEKNGLGMGVYQYAKAEGLPVVGFSRRTGDKIVQATEGIMLCERGQFYVPESADWMPDFAAEVYNWVGHKDQGDDVVDCLSEAGHVVAGLQKFVSQSENAAHRLGNRKTSVVFTSDGTALSAGGRYFDDVPMILGEAFNYQPNY
jgi:predicted phage terminase large subunit-like protein